MNFADLLIPDNIFYDLANNVVPAVVIFSLLIGIALMYLKDKTYIMRGTENMVEALTRITSWIARITPYGTFLIIANQFGTIQFNTVKQVSSYVILYIFGICLIIFWIFPRIIQMLTPIPAHRWLEQILPILLLAYTTNVVIVCLPYIVELLKKETLLLDPKDETAQNQIQGTVSVVFNLPLGALFITVFVFFISVFYNLPLLIGSQIKLFVITFLSSLGAVGIGSWLNSLTFILDSLGLPLDAVNLYLTTLPFTSGFQSMLSVIEISSISLFITLSSRKMLTFSWQKIIKNCVYIAIPVVAVIGIIKLYNPLPKIKNETKSIYELNITSSIPVKIFKRPPAPETTTGDTFDNILSTKVLRVGYNPNCAPFCFLNMDGNVVGYDVAFAYELAYDLGCRLELVPMTYENVIGELNERLYDIAMSAVTINDARLRTLTFTRTYQSPRIIIVVQEKGKKLFRTIDSINENTKIKIAVLRGSSYEPLARELFPGKQLVFLDDYDQFKFNDPSIALLWEEQEALAWSLVHRGYRIIVPEPLIGADTLSYAIRNDSPRFLHYLNQWLELKKAQGFTERQTELWIKGKTEIAAPVEPRWSIVRNVLNWVD